MLTIKGVILILLVSNIIVSLCYPTFGQNLPVINDDNLQVKIIANGLHFPTTIDFLGPNDILVLEKDNGTVRRILEGKLLTEPVLDVSVANKWDRGMLGIAVSKNHIQDNKNSNIYVFIYLTESEKQGSDHCLSWKSCLPGGEPKGNRLYRYRWDGYKLIEPKLLLDLPAVPGPAHNGGTVMIGPDNNVYLVTGDVRLPNTKSQNIRNGLPPDGTSGILRITQDGHAVGNGILGKGHPLNLYYAYGIRNSYGMDFDPVTGKLWDTENGYLFGDEINLVNAGFNSGWAKVQGIWDIKKLDEYGVDALNHGEIVLNPRNLVDFNGKGKYSNPELIWNKTVGLTALTFVTSNKLGTQYQNDMLVADFYGKIYRFEMSDDRKTIEHRELIEDRMVDSSAHNDDVFARGFNAITDIKIGPEGYLYVVSIINGTIYRISPNYVN